ncbi:hypothetical protein Hs30E_15930 [Lactococcus hodotermopsidis]|uniref:DUF218 domain-containing protein n=1 Tax=Pseudolactococcus hodotermopsidis TaxID=2709157 RepID=A0A6A0BCE8_9LACT|nr:YdcF family protein [Lactococcus hodotermopsidis]GFH43042.1 hypothetical protein Hs30E_15930 [Lactococcus hodotermopsidis]
MKKKIVQVIGELTMLGGIYVAVMLGLIFSGTHYQAEQNADTLLVLGAEVRGNSAETAYPSPVLKERLNAALGYIAKNPKTTIIVCGGQGKDAPISEASCMAKYLSANGVPRSQILLEDKSGRTQENIENAKKLIPLKKVVIVTSDFHAYRAKMLAKRTGIKTVSLVPAISRTGQTINMYGREIFALGKGLIFDW